MRPKRAVITYVSHRLHSSPSTAREQSLRLVHLCTILRVVLRRRSLSAIPLDPTAQAFLYACPATGCIAAPVFINISRESPSRRPYVGPPCQWILNLLCYHVVSIAFTKFINWRRLNIEQSYGLRASPVTVVHARQHRLRVRQQHYRRVKRNRPTVGDT